MGISIMRSLSRLVATRSWASSADGPAAYRPAPMLALCSLLSLATFSLSIFPGATLSGVALPGASSQCWGADSRGNGPSQRSHQGSHQGIQWMESLSEAHQATTRDQRLILVHFWSPSCGPCLQLERNVLSRNDVADLVGEHYAAVKIDISQQPELARYFQVRSIPTDVIVTATGEEIHRQVSAQDPEQFMALLRQHARPKQPRPQPQALPLGLEGFCPVALVEENRWQEGDPRSDLEHHQIVYRFASPGHRERFLQQPQRYVPAFGGLDVVQYREEGRTVMGKREHGVMFGDHYYLFADEGALRRFWQSPDRYAERPRANAYRAQANGTQANGAQTNRAQTNRVQTPAETYRR